MATPVIRRLKAADWPLYKQLRLSALKDSPDAFGSRYSDAIQYENDWWRRRLTEAKPDLECPMVALLDSVAMGLAWAEIEPPDLTTSHLFQMWVDPAARGVGLGFMLVQQAISWAQSRQATAMQLEVTCGDRPARRLYERLGFVAVGAPVPQRPGEPLLEQRMELRF